MKNFGSIKFPFYKQLDSMDCGPTCLRMIAKHHGKTYSVQFLREKCYINRAGVSLKGIAEAAELIGFRSLAVKIPLTPPPKLTKCQCRRWLKHRCPVSFTGTRIILWWCIRSAVNMYG
ncbi:MAG: cysteine peptidase family C39 domain-containing protein [Saprospiraceae bacterium]